jgi:hypothetical protein
MERLGRFQFGSCRPRGREGGRKGGKEGGKEGGRTVR